MLGKLRQWLRDAEAMRKYRTTIRYHISLYEDGTLNEAELIELLAKGALILDSPQGHQEMM